MQNTMVSFMSIRVAILFLVTLLFAFGVDAARTKVSVDGTDYTIKTRPARNGITTIKSIQFPLAIGLTRSIKLASVGFSSKGYMTYVRVDNEVYRIKYKRGKPTKAVCKSGCGKRELSDEAAFWPDQEEAFDQDLKLSFTEGRELQVFEDCDTCKDMVKLLCGASVAAACLAIALLSGPAAVAVGALCAVFGGICALDGGAEVQCQQLGDCPIEEEEEEEEAEEEENNLSCGNGQCDEGDKCCYGDRLYLYLLCDFQFGNSFCCAPSSAEVVGC